MALFLLIRATGCCCVLEEGGVTPLAPDALACALRVKFGSGVGGRTETPHSSELLSCRFKTKAECQMTLPFQVRTYPANPRKKERGTRTSARLKERGNMPESMAAPHPGYANDKGGLGGKCLTNVRSGGLGVIRRRARIREALGPEQGQQRLMARRPGDKSESQRG